ncbi:hypothetical protein SK128_019719 [Halocaridina rubra]|uniref:Uncharacterized protein n=1 Tax=Halocaridina rubra TaxID=373956 RepID=A0AAN8ZRJ7_HALRR
MNLTKTLQKTRRDYRSLECKLETSQMRMMQKDRMRMKVLQELTAEANGFNERYTYLENAAKQLQTEFDIKDMELKRVQVENEKRNAALVSHYDKKIQRLEKIIQDLKTEVEDKEDDLEKVKVESQKESEEKIQRHSRSMTEALNTLQERLKEKTEEIMKIKEENKKQLAYMKILHEVELTKALDTLQKRLKEKADEIMKIKEENKKQLAEMKILHEVELKKNGEQKQQEISKGSKIEPERTETKDCILAKASQAATVLKPQHQKPLQRTKVGKMEIVRSNNAATGENDTGKPAIDIYGDSLTKYLADDLKEKGIQNFQVSCGRGLRVTDIAKFTRNAELNEEGHGIVILEGGGNDLVQLGGEVTWKNIRDTKKDEGHSAEGLSAVVLE